MLLHNSFFPVTGIIQERSISALLCPLFFAVCYLFKTVLQANFFYTIIYLDSFDPPSSLPLQASC